MVIGRWSGYSFIYNQGVSIWQPCDVSIQTSAFNPKSPPEGGASLPLLPYSCLSLVSVRFLLPLRGLESGSSSSTSSSSPSPASSSLAFELLAKSWGVRVSFSPSYWREVDEKCHQGKWSSIL